MKLEIRYYLAIFQRRFLLFAVIAAAVIGLAGAVAVMLPTVYRTDAQLLVEPSLIPGDLAASTVSIGVLEQLQIIQQRLYTRSNLLDIADRLQLTTETVNATPDDILAMMRDRVDMDIRSGRRGQATLVTISAEAPNSQDALAIANELVSFVLEEDISFRTEMAGQTLSFFENEVERLGQELDRINTSILAFKNENVDSLPEGSEYRFNRQSVLQERLSQIRRERTQLTEQRNRLLEVFEATGNVPPAQDSNLTRSAAELRDLRAELNRALAIFSESNPQIRLLRTRIAQLEALEKTNAPAPAEPTTGTTMMDVQLAELAARSATLDRQIEAVEAEMAEIDAAIRATPANAIALDGLERNYANIQDQYNAAIRRLSTAATGERIEALSKGQRISIVDQATLPRDPISPNRKLIAGGGTVFGLALGIGAVILAELMRDFVRRPSDLTRAIGVTPLATIPYVETRFEQVRKRLFWVTIGLLFIIAGVLAILFVRGGLTDINDFVRAVGASIGWQIGGR